MKESRGDSETTRGEDEIEARGSLTRISRAFASVDR